MRFHYARYSIALSILLLVIIAFFIGRLRKQNSPKATVLQLRESAHKTVKQDRLRASLRIEHKANSASEVQEYINRKMASALAMVQAQPDVRVETRYYNVYQTSHTEEASGNTPPKTPKRTYWYGSQTLTMDSAQSEPILQLSGRLQQQGFATDRLDYYLSRDKRESYRDELIATVLENMKQRTQLIGRQIGLPSVQFAEINLDGHNPTAAPELLYARTPSAAALSEAPVATTGEAEVSITVEIKVHLSK